MCIRDCDKAEYKLINSWAAKKLDRNWFGERLHRGYHIFCSKVTVPLIRKETKRGEFTYYLQQYAKWCFTNSSRMLMGQRFNIFALPNNILWTMILFTIGLFVSKEQAEKSWKKLWR